MPDLYKVIQIGEPCPYCGKTVINISLKINCYSSWIECECTECFAYTHISADKNPNDSFPNPIKNWIKHGLKHWDNPNTEINKKTILKKKRGEQNNG